MIKGKALAFGIFLGNFFGGLLVLRYHPLTALLQGVIASGLVLLLLNIVASPQKPD